MFLGIDNIGYKGDGYPADEVRARNIAELIQEGFENQILLSLDICMKQHLHSYGGKGYDHLQRKFLPLLAGLGVDQEKITKMTVTNPARALAFEPGKRSQGTIMSVYDQFGIRRVINGQKLQHQSRGLSDGAGSAAGHAGGSEMLRSN